MADAIKPIKFDAIVDLAMDDQARAQRIIEMARIIEETADDLPPDSEPSRMRACAQVIYEAAELIISNLECVEVTMRQRAQRLSGDAVS